MPDLRYDPVNDQWIAMAENRIGRPSEFEPSARPNPLTNCPFCAGNESSTPPAIATYTSIRKSCEVNPAGRSHAKGHSVKNGAATSHSATPHPAQGKNGTAKSPVKSGQLQSEEESIAVCESGHQCESEPESAGWLTRVIPNRFPAFGAEAPGISMGLVDSIAGTPYAASGSETNYQELIIESSRHVAGYAELNPQELRNAFLVYRDRLLALQDGTLKHAMLFKNCRYEAGASLSHVHSQLIAMDFVPPAIEAKFHRLEQVGEQNPSQLVLKKIAEFESREKIRVVAETENWVAFCPFAGRFAFQMWVVAKSNMEPYWCQSDQELGELAQLVQKLVTALEVALDFPAYNVLFHNPPFGRKHSAGQSYVELFARVSNPAGFEWGTNCWINPVSPETSAERLRQCWSK